MPAKCKIRHDAEASVLAHEKKQGIYICPELQAAYCKPQFHVDADSLLSLKIGARNEPLSDLCKYLAA